MFILNTVHLAWGSTETCFSEVIENQKDIIKYKHIGHYIEEDRAFFSKNCACADLLKELGAIKELPKGSPKKDRMIDVSGISARTRIATESETIMRALSSSKYELGANKHFCYIWNIKNSKPVTVCGQYKPTDSQPGNVFVCGLGAYNQTIFNELESLEEYPHEIADQMISCSHTGGVITKDLLRKDGITMTTKQLSLLHRLTYLITDVEVARRIPRGTISYHREKIPGVKLPYGVFNAMALTLIQNDQIDFKEFILPNTSYGFYSGTSLENPRQITGIVLPAVLNIFRKFSDLLGDEDLAKDAGFKRSDFERDQATDLILLNKKGINKLLIKIYGD